MKKVRVATTEAGDKYLVQRIDFTPGQPPMVYCWGELLSFRGLSSTHNDGSKKFLKADVTITEIPKTRELLEEMFAQTKRKLRENGDLLVGPRGGLYYKSAARDKL